MELYGSLLNISGSVTASAFTGSFIGDGSGLSGIQASGVTGLNLSQIASGDATASITTSGFTVNKNTQIQGNLSVTGALIANEYIVSSSVIYMTTSFASGSSAFGNDNNDVHQFTGSVQITGSISLNGQAIGTGKLDETTFQSYTSSNNNRVSSLETSSGSLNSFTSSINTTIKSKLDSDNVISGSVQVNITGTTGYSTFSSSISNSIDNLSSSVAITTSGLTNTISSLSSSVAITTSGLTSTITSLSSSLTSSIGSLSSSIATIDLNQDNRLTALETSSGSLNIFTSSINTTIKSKLDNDGVISGSSQILNNSNIVSSSAQVTAYGFATTGSNLFKGTQTHSGSILPSVDNTYDLGSVEYQWRDVYISSGSLYIDGTKVLSSTAQELTITTDSGQSIKILEGTTDSIILQTADGDIELKSSADGDILLDPTNGKIMLKGPVEVLSGQKIQSSVGGTPVVFANDIVVSGSIDLTGTIDGIDLQSLSSSLNTRIGGIETATGSLNSYTSSNTTNINAIHTATSSLNSFTSSINTTIKSKLDNDGVISGSVQVILTGTTGYSTFSSSVSTSIGEISGSIATTTSGLSSSVGSLSSSVATTTSGLTSTITNLSSSVSSSIGSLSSSVATTTSELSSTITSLSSSVATTTSGLSSTITNLSSSVATYNLGQDNRLISIEGKTGSYATTGSNVFQGSQTITGSLFISQNLIVGGSSSINFVSQSTLNIGTNLITVNAQNPETRFGGLAVIDSGSSPTVSGSMLFDSINDQWIFVHQNQSTVTSSVLLMGPQTINSLGSEIYPTTNRVVKSINSEHLGDSNISDNGTTVTILSNTIINGTISATGTTLVSGSAQISHDSSTGYVANRHIDHTAVSITAGNGLSGGGDISATRTVTLDTGSVHFLDGVKKELNTEGVISGSSQVLNGSGVWSGSAQLPSGVVSGSSQVLSGTGIWSGSAQLPSGVVSGSSQISFGSITGIPSGLVSGSSQVLAGTTIHSGAFFNGISVVSGSAQISFNGITDKPTLVSGSSQITYGSISSIPSGIVSGSAQVDLTSTTNYSSGIKTRLNAEGVLSGSAQVVAALPSGTVSGSAQVTLSSTSGFGSYLNQAVLTTSSPTFGGMTLTGALGGTSATFSSNVTINGTVIGTDQTFGGAYRTFAFGTNSNGYNRIFAANDTSDGLYLNAATGRGIYFRVNGGGTDVVSISSAGAVTLTGTISASNFSGSSSGTNTGDQTNITGNSATTSQRDFSSDISTTGMGRFTGWYAGNAATGLAAEIGISAGQAYVIAYNRQTSTYAAVNIESTASTLRISGSTVNVVTGALQQGGNQVLHAGNFTSYAMSGAGYSANQNLNTTSSPTFAGITNNGTYTQATTSTQPLTINGDSGDTNGLFRIQMDSVSDSFASGARTYLGDGGIDIFLGTSNSSYTPSNTYIALNHSGEISMGAGSANKHFTLSTSGNLTISGTIGASNFSGSSSGTNTGDQTLNSLGALSNSADSEQDVGTRNLYYNDGAKRVFSDPRWNESGYDGDLGTLHIYSTTAAGANYGRAGIALYNGSAYQYLTTKASTTGLFANNSLILTAGNYTSYAMAGAGYSANQNLNTTSSPTFAALSTNGIVTITNGTPSGAASSAANAHLRIDSSGNQYIEFRTTAASSGIMQGTLYSDNGRNAFIGFKEYTGGSNYGESIHISILDFSGSDAGSGIYLGASSDNLNGVTTPWFSIRGGTSYFYGNVLPDTNNSRNLGSASVGWANVYTNDLHLSNMNKPEGNDIDGTSGNWTIQEGAENLYIINNNNGKKFKISLEEII